MKIKIIYPYTTTLGFQFQSFQFKNRFRLRHELQLQTQLEDPLFGELEQNDNGEIQPVIEQNYQLDQQQTHSLHYQISSYSTVYLKSQFTNVGEINGIYNPKQYLRYSNWEQYSLHLGYEYKNFAVEYNFKSFYREPKVRFVYQIPFPWTYFKDITCTKILSQTKTKKPIIAELVMLETSDKVFEEESKIINIENIHQFELSPIEIPEDMESIIDSSDSIQTNPNHFQHYKPILVKSRPITGIAEETFMISNSNSALVWYLFLAFSIGIGVGIGFKKYFYQISKWVKNKFT
uniref:Transmembrane protein n=1 Tax=Derbesia sp. WEST4838 TaxID=1847751 RepID=A0A1C9JBK0_9CHLO|nr:hypothetical protein [Derbesia sp. WEST4838]AOP19228.1 hypothetical protein [Derbesia sp. WEST4838]